MGKVCHVVACCNQVISRSDSSALVYRGLFFPDSSFPPPITPSPPPPTHTHCLAFCLYFSPPQSPSCRLTLSLRLASVTQSLNPVRTSNNKLSGAAQLQKRCISFCTNPFVLSSFIFVYLHRPGGKELLEHLGNVVCDFLNLAWG